MMWRVQVADLRAWHFYWLVVVCLLTAALHIFLPRVGKCHFSGVYLLVAVEGPDFFAPTCPWNIPPPIPHPSMCLLFHVECGGNPRVARSLTQPQEMECESRSSGGMFESPPNSPNE